LNQELARLVIIEAFHACNCLGSLIPLLKEALPEAEYKNYLPAIAGCLDTIGENILQKVYFDNPGLEEQVQSNIEKYGRAF
jgi:hypothetical protein